MNKPTTTASPVAETAASNYRQSIELMNRAVGLEIAASMQYMYFHVHCEDAGYHYLARMFRNISITEMRHIEQFADRILFLKGDVDMNPAFRTKQITDVKGMLELSRQLERSTIDHYNAWAKACADGSDAASHTLFRTILEEEEHHFDTFDTEGQNMEDYGKEYLALQSIARSRAENKHKVEDWEK